MEVCSMTRQLKNVNKRPQFIKNRNFWLWLVIGSGLIFSAVYLTSIHLSNERRYNTEVTEMKGDVQRVAHGILEPMGGMLFKEVELWYGEEYPGEFPLLGGCLNGCPGLFTQWYLLADKAKEDEFGRQAEEAFEGKMRREWSLSMTFGVLGKSERPYEPPEGKEWFNIRIFVSRYKLSY